MDRRSNWVDIAKAIGIVLVVFGHVARGVTSAGLIAKESPLAVVDSVIYTFHMPLFFLLSGLFFAQGYARRKAGELMWSKVDTIVYPYIVWSIVQGSVQAGLSSYTNEAQGFDRLLTILWNPISPFWFLYALFVIFALATLAMWWLAERHLVVLITATTGVYLITAQLTAPLEVHYITDNMVFFAIGMAAAHRSAVSNWATPSRRRVASLVVATGVGQYVFHAVLDARYADRGIATLVLALLSIATVVAISQRLAVLSPAAALPRSAIVKVGVNSMGIYVMHILAGSGARVVLSSIFGVESVAVHLVMGTTVGVLAPLAAVAVTNRLGLRFLVSAPISETVRRRFRQRRVAIAA